MSPEPEKQPPESARRLRSEVSRIRLRARAVLLLEAFLAAVAVDFLYDLAGFGVFLLTGKSNYFPPFLFVIFAVFALYALGKTRFLPFCRSLDRKHRLKERLASAEAFRLSGGIPDDVVEAQARESLAAIDLPGIRKTIRPRLAAHLGAIALLAVIMGTIVWQFPGFFEPMNFFTRHGRQIVTSYRHRTSIEEMMAEAERQGDGAGESRTGTEPDEAEEDEGTPEEGEKMAAGEPPPGAEETEESAPEEGEEKVAEAEREESPPEPSLPEEKKAVDAPQPEGEKGRAASSNTGGVPGKVPAVEETTRPSPLAEKPYAGLAPEPFKFDSERTKGYLPPIPLFKLFAGPPTMETLIDPDAINIVPEAYEEKYRRHIIAYFERLQSFRGDSHGP